MRSNMGTMIRVAVGRVFNRPATSDNASYVVLELLFSQGFSGILISGRPVCAAGAARCPRRCYRGK